MSKGTFKGCKLVCHFNPVFVQKNTSIDPKYPALCFPGGILKSIRVADRI